MVFAHTAPQPREWEPLDVHLDEVALRAKEFSHAFGAGSWGQLAGRWHDLGKYAPAFQDYLRESFAGKTGLRRVDHSTAGALHASRTFPGGVGRLLAFVIAGHHAGLADWSSSEDASLERRLNDPRPESAAALAAAPTRTMTQPAPPAPAQASSGTTNPLAVAMFTRMLFSSLIDADRLATERFMDPEKAAGRERAPVAINALRAALDTHLVQLTADRAGNPSPVDELRRTLLADCRGAASLPPGLFSLTAPTGSGKTFASMAFALAHAERHGMRRVVYALPFTSVTEQNAAEFRDAFSSLGPEIVLEHHSAYRPSSADEDDPVEVRRRLAVENWGASIIVTTNVQLFESLFSANPSDSRKLHRLAGSVIVLDEAQTLPVTLLRPTLAALEELARGYGATIVFCSATMPAVGWREEFLIGIKNLREIVPEPIKMSEAMRRTQVRRVGPRTDEQLADAVTAEPQALVIVNTRRHAARLFGLLKSRADDVLHLSALMCPAHRTDKVAEMKRRLIDKRPCRVVSTQVVEAGVDIDFPVVFRAMTGLDSIVQAAGRCNREGRAAMGRVEVFDTDEPAPRGLRQALADGSQVLTEGVDALDLGAIESYFRLHYWTRRAEWDGGVESGRSVGLTDMLSPSRLMFRTVGERYRLIDEWSVPIVVPYKNDGSQICGQLLKSLDPWWIQRTTVADRKRLFRAAQRFTVVVPPYVRMHMVEQTFVSIVANDIGVLTNDPSYDENIGLLMDAQMDPARLIT